MNIVDAGTRVLLVVVLGTAVVTKTRTRTAWRDFVSSLRPLGAVAPLRQLPAAWLAGGAVAAEAVAVAALAVPASALFGLALAALVLLAYGVGIHLAVRGGVTVTCRCFGARSSGSLGRAEVARNLSLAAVAALTFGVGAPTTLPAPSGPALLVTATAAVVLALVVVRWDDVSFALRGVGS